LAPVASGNGAHAADHLKLAVGQCGNWDSSQVELGTRAGFYAKHGVEVEGLCTQGTGETQQVVISGSADIGIGVGTLGALGAFAKGAPVRIISGSATGNADFWIVKADSPLPATRDDIRTLVFIQESSRAQLAELARLVDQGHVRPQVGAVYPLAQAVEAYSAKAAGGVPGRIVLQPAA